MDLPRWSHTTWRARLFVRGPVDPVTLVEHTGCWFMVLFLWWGHPVFLQFVLELVGLRVVMGFF